MALSGSVNGSVGYGNCYVRYDWSATQSIANNTSTITANLYFIVGQYTTVNATESGGVYIDGTQSTYNNGTQYRTAGTYLMKTYSRTISHNSDGTKTFSFSGTMTSGWSSLGTLSVSGSATLNTIPRASTPTLSSSSINIGESVTIYTNRLSSSFTHTIDFDFPPSFGATLSTGVATSYTWNTTSQASSLYAQIPNANSGVGTIWLHTYNGGTLIGSKSVNLTLNVTNSNPTFTTFTYKDVNATTTTITGNDQYLIQGYSTLRATILAVNKAVALNSATMNKYIFNINGVSVEQAYSTSDINKDIGVISASTNQVLTVTAQDSRTNQTARTATVNMLPYAIPSVLATGTRQNNFEATTTIHIEGSISLLTIASVNKNAVNGTSGVQYRYRENGGTWGSWTNKASTTNSSTGAITVTDFTLSLDNTKQYNFEVSITDKLVTSVYSFNVDIGIPLVRIGTDGNLFIAEKPVYACPFKIGDILMSTSSSNPNLTFTGTTWATWGTGRVPVGIDTGQSEFNTIEETGGAKTVAGASHNHSIGTHNHAMPMGFDGTNMFLAATSSAGSPLYGSDVPTNWRYAPGISGWANAGWRRAYTNTNTSYNSGNTTPSATSVLQPYITTYMWKRTS